MLFLNQLHKDLYLGSHVGGWMEAHDGSDGDWLAATHEQADTSMTEARDRAVAKAFPRLDAAATAAGLAAAMAAEVNELNPMGYLGLGCYHATTGDLDSAVGALHDAVRGLSTSQIQRNFGRAADREKGLAEELLAAIADGTHDRVLAAWREQTVVNLRLSPLVD